MEYRKKVAALSCAIAALAMAWAAALILDPARRGARADAYSWLDPRDAGMIGAIEISLPREGGGETEPLSLALVGGRWVERSGGRNYPARQARVGDFLAELSRRSAQPVRATSAAAHERLGLTEGAAARVTASAGLGPPVLDLLIGNSDLTGRNSYMRRAGRSEARLGDDSRLSSFVRAPRSSWHNLLLFPENEDGAPPVADVMRVTVRPPPEDGEGGGLAGGFAEPMVFARVGRSWEASFGAVSSARVDAYVRDILMAAGEGFAGAAEAAGGAPAGSIALEFADGSFAEIAFAEIGGNGRRLALVSGSAFAIELSGWAHRRLFPSPESFGL